MANRNSIEPVETSDYAEKYSERSFFDKITNTIKSAGLKLIYEALLLFYVTENPNCPMRIKAAIFAAPGYFISLPDVIPDFTPIVDYSDDAGAIAIFIDSASATCGGFFFANNGNLTRTLTANIIL